MARKGRRRIPKPEYTPEPPPKERVSPPWYVALMFALMAIGVVVIVLNYIDLLPGGQRSIFLYLGLASIGAGFVMTLNFH